MAIKSSRKEVQGDDGDAAWGDGAAVPFYACLGREPRPLCLDLKDFDWALEGGWIDVEGELSILGGGTVSDYIKLAIYGTATFLAEASFVSGSGADGLLVYNAASVAITGDITADYDGVRIDRYGSGDRGPEVVIVGNIKAKADGIYVVGGTVSLTGNITASRTGLIAYESTVAVEGNINVMGAYAILGIGAQDSHVTIAGDITLAQTDPEHRLWVCGARIVGLSQLFVGKSIAVNHANDKAEVFGVLATLGSQATINGSIVAADYIGFFRWLWSLGPSPVPGSVPPLPDGLRAPPDDVSATAPIPPISPPLVGVMEVYEKKQSDQHDADSHREGYLQYSYHDPEGGESAYVWVLNSVVAPPSGDDNNSGANNSNTNPPPGKPSDIPQTGDTGHATAAALLACAFLGASVMLLAKKRLRKGVKSRCQGASVS
ncbi:MAG: hypothetical protein FWD27_04940 [Coriobacteriia bacterium]|nr:hypothetical protein [Coriobacteriia bacterium]